ncbi:UDP-3-O-(3-hydroxymyristoyl)glucosamine N-acyltransferase [Algihabitans albus]|uniref:UDP-3-O-(3-hydroxymyristoyl)glucosamine N-acyltransferase n=1 Tax=Algihabitans albus TaxID=2164067 RepID=UPI000E5CFC27|nr:UDP-3-O-(3-hydroxymyristoyl)glucosamine N-acyltransferase [Algihabitans albus]
MADPRFFTNVGPFRMDRLAEIADAELGGAADPALEVSDVAPLDTAGPEDLSFLDNRRYVKVFEASRAGACIVHPDFAARAPQGMALLITPQPYKAYARVAGAFYPRPTREGGVHSTAIVDDTATLGADVRIGPYAIVGPNVDLGAGVCLHAQVVVDSGVSIGAGTEVMHGASLSHCSIGRNCLIHAGARIGNRGFGFAIDPNGYVDVPQLGCVQVGDGVEIGANATIDRGAGPDTVIGDGCKIDNLVQLGHNVRLGRGCVLVAQSGIAGSSKLDDFVMIAAQGGVGGHLTLHAKAQLAAKSGLMHDIPPGETYGGLPAMPLKDFFRLVTLWKRQLKNMEKK